MFMKTEFVLRSLMAWGMKLLLSLSVFCHHAPEALARWQWTEKMVTVVIWVFEDFSSPAFAAFEVDVLPEREEQTLRCAQLSAWLSVELCSPDLMSTIPHWDALSQYTFYGPWVESFQDCWWDPEFPQLVQSLPGFLNLSLNVCSPCQVLGDVYTKVLEATHPLHRGPTDHKRGVGPLLSLSEVHDQLFSFAHVHRERDSCPGTMMWVSPPHPSMQPHHCCWWGPRTTVSSANLMIEVELWEDMQSWVYRE